MPDPYDPKKHKVVPLSEVHANRRETEQSDISRADLRNLLAEVIDERVADKFSRLQKSIDLMMVHIGAVQSGEVEDSALKVTTDLNASTDVAVATIQLRPEDYYTYTTGDIAELLGIKINEVVKLVGSLGLRNNSEYHKPIKTGKKNFVQKYSQPAFEKIKQEIHRENNLIISNQEIDRRA
ncbi:MAG: hypothetical protein M1G31_11175 [Pseudanabaena sp. Salubria-1]|jgi:hypothetical protein|nr:hypothetical protein [Pseudanabaena sp. Salubria-1]